MISSEKQIDEYIEHFALTSTGQVLLKRKIRHILEVQLSHGGSLYDLDKSIINKHIHELVHDKPWISINEHV